jgi:hypothetical protein
MTLDGSGGACGGRIERCEGSAVLLVTDPAERTYSTRGEPRAPRKDSWVGAGLFILDGTGAGQYRIVTGHEGRRWAIDRRNTLHSNAGFDIQGVTHDVIVESCSVIRTEKGILLSPEPEHVLLRRNRFSDVQEPVSGKGAAKASIQP